ncbi:MAG TPA: nuclear transport factor 2 family protein [Gemmatimonadales bacterium]
MRPLLPFLTLILLGAVPATDPTAEVLAFERAACEAFRANDVVAIDTLLTDDVTLILSDGTIERKADLLREAREEVVRYSRFENVDQVVRFYGPRNAVVTGRTIISGVAKDGSSVEVDVIFTDTVVKAPGGWKFAAGHVSRVPPRR